MDQINQDNFAGHGELEALLESLINTFVEFKTHEQIENKLIMKTLKAKLKRLSIKNSAVCNCHKVSTVTSTGLPRVRKKMKKISGHEKVRKKQHWSEKLEKITKSQEKVRKNTECSLKIQWNLPFYRHLWHLFIKFSSLAALSIISISNFYAQF